jgi:hypothetical protein
LAHVKVGQYRIKLPKSKVARQALGGGLVVGGTILAPLPMFGVWMLPAGLLVLSTDSSRVRRFRRVQEIKVVRWWRARQAAKSSS